MPSPDQKRLVEQIHASSRQLVLALTGGGSGAIAALFQVPGASASMLEAVVPYASTAMEQWLGGPIEQYCSEKTARAMAMRSFQRACELSGAGPHSLIGIGVTASLATNRRKRGAHRVHVAWQTAAATNVVTALFDNGDCARNEEEEFAARLILHAIAEACQVSVAPIVEPAGIRLERRAIEAPKEWMELLLGQRISVDLRAQGDRRPPRILFPGAFNPPHWGHEQMAAIAAARLGGPVTYELSITNVDKPPLDFLEIDDRLNQLTGRPVFLTRAPTFLEKSALAPGCVFVVGADTLQRIADPRYYGNDPANRDAAIARIAERGCRFLVFGRFAGAHFATASAIEIPPTLRALCDEVSESDFRADVSSTELRADTMGSRAGKEAEHELDE
jgi:nicotinamide mononucleotide (NMN) deamidase PncC